jgi:Ca-activated chloride channel family protein
MSFIWPTMLLLMVLIPLSLALYLRLQKQRRRALASYGSLGALQQTGGRKLGLRRHLPPIFFLIGLSILTFALARPKAVVSLPRLAGTVVLTFDVSGSMNATDMTPTRMEAAKAAAKDFVERQPTSVQVGIVAFSESGLSVQVPTNDKDAVLDAINRLTPARGTSLANGIVSALGVIEAMENPKQEGYYSNATPTPAPPPTAAPPGSHDSAAIVLLTDGENTVQPDPMLAAQIAAERGVRVHTVGIGSPAGSTLKVEGFTVQTRLDEATLQAISQMTEGQYYNAQNEEDLRAIYQNLGAQLIVKPEETEITSLLVGAGLLFLLIGGVVSLFWFSRLP